MPAEPEREVWGISEESGWSGLNERALGGDLSEFADFMFHLDGYGTGDEDIVKFQRLLKRFIRDLPLVLVAVEAKIREDAAWDAAAALLEEMPRD